MVGTRMKKVMKATKKKKTDNVTIVLYKYVHSIYKESGDEITCTRSPNYEIDLRASSGYGR